MCKFSPLVKVIFFVLFLILSELVVFGQEDQKHEASDTTEACETESDFKDSLSGDWCGARTKLQDQGIEFGLYFNSVYQNNVHGGLDTKDAQRFTGRYDLEIILDLEKLFKLQGGTLYTLAEGNFGNGLDEKVGDLFGVNWNAVGYRSIDVWELWYQQNLLSDKLKVRVGKLDLRGMFECRGCPISFDGNTYANDETSQFINTALVFNPTIPFPQNALGLIVHYNPIEWFYTSIGAADAQADFRETGFNTAFHDEDYFIGLYEFGFIPQFCSSRGPLTGAYRFGLWYDPQPKQIYFDDHHGLIRPKNKRDDLGFYMSFDQMVYSEDNESDQGLGFFFRYGFAPDESNDIETFWSIGSQYQGLVPKRDDDVLGFGVAQGVLSDNLRWTGVNPARETVFELYYNIQIAQWLNLTPDVQYLMDPAGDHSDNDAAILGLRLQMTL